MYMYYYKCNKNVYDGLRDYCICERVNEEYLRTLVEKPLVEKPKHFSIVKDALTRLIQYETVF